MDSYPVIRTATANGDGIGAPSQGGSGSLKTRACANCARLKMKCRWPASAAGQTQETSCIRFPAMCRRLCSGRGEANQPQLEKKIDGLVSMLALSQRIRASRTATSLSTPESHDAGVKIRLQKPPQAEAPQRQPGGDAHEPPQMPLAIPPKPSTTFQLIPGFSFSLEEVISYFDRYRRELMPNYPFVVIPEDLDPRALYATSQCLFWTIMAAVAPQSPDTQKGVENWFRQYIADRVVVNQEKSLEILQAILLRLTWAEFHFCMKTEATNFVHLATALALDLKLDRSPEATRLQPRSLLAEAFGKSAPRPKPPSADEKRAVLGLYHCCESLAESPLGSDLFLVALVKMQRIADRADSMLPPGFDAVGSVSGTYLLPMDMAINNVRRELCDFMSMQPDSVREKRKSFADVFKAYYQVALMRFAEPAIPMQPLTLVGMGALQPEPLQRFNTIWECLLAAVDFFDTLFSIHPHELLGLPTSVMGLLAFAIVTSSRLLLLGPSIDWQPAMARRKLDFADVMKRLSDRFEDADAWAKEAGRRRRLVDGDCAQFFRLSSKLRWIRQWYLSRIPQEQPSMDDTQPPSEPFPYSDVVFWQGYELEGALWPDYMAVPAPEA
ncbi:hypothetical protein Trco_007050 [Trichoderma cornu-damae]|uniref:Transcription factor domain-containing protein n=1 Tax=Trichoderma cornu-damae TaxID=654480 RepID=A0A9P8QLR9_9HYPO|nr:hypothetical protein Trco_007050 [Trichoderma cornu-damae]